MIVIEENEEIFFRWIIDSLKDLYKNENRLIERKLKQECVKHHFANYLEKHMPYKYSYFAIVDIEYDKNYADPKTIIDEKGRKQAIRPDILIHQRESENQIMALECDYDYLTKKTKEKIIKLRQEPYSYKFTLGISYQPERKYFLLYYYIALEDFLDAEKEEIEKVSIKFNKSILSSTNRIAGLFLICLTSFLIRLIVSTVHKLSEEHLVSLWKESLHVFLHTFYLLPDL